ncbi:hypothetical protein BDN72DRAFT_850428 [Pluteus cervinus]|uniref:Uncharacterized protein n=1 Tax=Pluteus cervinus TaxID=181527 RepID=A0ACD3A4B7_9AGAR|nr:hypothetical protein BDN72DRAFT_850428 [Pluteus cervinus]
MGRRAKYLTQEEKINAARRQRQAREQTERFKAMRSTQNHQAYLKKTQEKHVLQALNLPRNIRTLSSTPLRKTPTFRNLAQSSDFEGSKVDDKHLEKQVEKQEEKLVEELDENKSVGEPIKNEEEYPSPPFLAYDHGQENYTSHGTYQTQYNGSAPDCDRDNFNRSTPSATSNYQFPSPGRTPALPGASESPPPQPGAWPGYGSLWFQPSQQSYPNTSDGPLYARQPPQQVPQHPTTPRTPLVTSPKGSGSFLDPTNGVCVPQIHQANSLASIPDFTEDGHLDAAHSPRATATHPEGLSGNLPHLDTENLQSPPFFPHLLKALPPRLQVSERSQPTTPSVKPTDVNIPTISVPDGDSLLGLQIHIVPATPTTHHDGETIQGQSLFDQPQVNSLSKH